MEFIHVTENHLYLEKKNAADLYITTHLISLWFILLGILSNSLFRRMKLVLPSPSTYMKKDKLFFFLLWTYPLSLLNQ